MYAAILILGAIILVLCVVGFVRSLWRSPSRRGAEDNYATPLPGIGDSGGRGDHADGGGHGGGIGGA